MRRLGVITLVMVGFVAGIAFVYSCGGGSSGNTAEPVDADTLSGYAYTHFATAAHSHTWTRVLHSSTDENWLAPDGSINISFILPPDLRSGGTINVDFYLKNIDNPSPPGNVVLSLAKEEKSIGDSFIPSTTPPPASEFGYKLVSIDGTGNYKIDEKVSWSVDIGACEILQLWIVRGDGGGFTQTFPGHVARAWVINYEKPI